MGFRVLGPIMLSNDGETMGERGYEENGSVEYRRPCFDGQIRLHVLSANLAK